MPIGLLTEGAPRVEEHKGMVAVWTVADDDQLGFVLPVGAAVQTAIKMLGLAEQLPGGNSQGMPVASIAVDQRVLDDGEDIVRLTFDLDGTPIRAFCDLTQFAEIAAAFAAASREIDKPRG